MENIKNNMVTKETETIEVPDLTEEFKDILQYDEKTKIKLITERLKSLIGQEIITEDDKILSVKSNKDIKHIKDKAILRQNKQTKTMRTTAINSIKDIIEKSRLKETREVDSSHNTSQETKDKKEKWDKVNIFNSVISIGGKNYNVIITTYTDKKNTSGNLKRSWSEVPPNSIQQNTDKSKNYLYEVYTKS
jgi:hypothetical protein